MYLETFRKFSKLSEIIFEIFWNDIILKILGNNSRNSTKFSEILLENFQSISGNLPKLYQKFFEMIFDIILKILGNIPRNFPIFLLNIFKSFLKMFGNISRYQNFSKLSKIIFDIVLTSRTRVCIASRSVLERIGYEYIRYNGIPMTSCFVGCIVSEATLLFVITLGVGIHNNW